MNRPPPLACWVWGCSETVLRNNTSVMKTEISDWYWYLDDWYMWYWYYFSDIKDWRLRMLREEPALWCYVEKRLLKIKDWWLIYIYCCDWWLHWRLVTVNTADWYILIYIAATHILWNVRAATHVVRAVTHLLSYFVNYDPYFVKCESCDPFS